MRIISPTAHGIIDYFLVIFLALSPTIFSMEGTLATFTYALSGVHLLLTILTANSTGLIKVIPFRIHGLIEIVVALALTAVAFYFNNQGSTLGFYFYLALVVAILLVFILTNFRGVVSKVA